MAFDVDLFVIGGGSGGVRAARIAAGQHGVRVALAEEYRMGGTCVIRGCVPKKLMVYASGFPQDIADARAYGWDAQIGGFDWGVFRARLDAELSRLEAAYRSGLTGAGVTIHDQRATLVDAHTVALADGTQIRAQHILIATGARPVIPPEWDGLGVMTSNEVFLMDALPQSIVIVGGGYIASEFAGILNGLGVRVTQICRGSQILRGFDDECRAHVAAGMTRAGIDLRLGATIAGLDRAGDGYVVRLGCGTELHSDAVLMATGRAPNSAGLGLDALGLTLPPDGAIPVDAYSQTAIPSIYAVGDVTNRAQLTPVAIREGHAFADTVFGGTPRYYDHALIPTAIFTQPEFGTVGLSEEQARAAGPCDIYTASFRPARSLFAGRDDRMLMKLVVRRGDGVVLGCHIVGDGAAEILQMAATAMGMGATKADFDSTLAIHPSVAEELVTMRNVTRSWDDQGLN